MPEGGPARRPARIIGLDPGSSRVGWGVLELRQRRWNLAACGVLRAGAGRLQDRLLRLYTGLLEVLDRWQPTEAAMEDIFHHRHARAALVLGHARGVLLLGLGLRGVEPHAYAPPRVKKAVTGSGAAGKDEVRRWVRRWLGAGDALIALDASDALAAALCHTHARARVGAAAGSSLRRR